MITDAVTDGKGSLRFLCSVKHPDGQFQLPLKELEGCDERSPIFELDLTHMATWTYPLCAATHQPLPNRLGTLTTPTNDNIHWLSKKELDIIVSSPLPFFFFENLTLLVAPSI